MIDIYHHFAFSPLFFIPKEGTISLIHFKAHDLDLEVIEFSFTDLSDWILFLHSFPSMPNYSLKGL